jgi:O-antigen ligase
MGSVDTAVNEHPLANVAEAPLKRVLGLLLVMVALGSLWGAELMGEYLLVAIPAVILCGIVFVIKPEMGIGLFISGISIFGIILTVIDFEKPILVYPAMTAALAFTTAFLILSGKAKIPEKSNLIIFSVGYFAIVFFMNVFRTDFAYHTSVKAFVLVVTCLLPFIMLNLYSGEPKLLIDGFKSTVYLGSLPILYSFANYFLGGMGNLMRFAPIEMVNLNTVARNIGLVALTAVWYFFESKSKTTRLYLSLFFITSVVLVVLTGSRASFLALLGAVVMFVVLFSGMSLTKRITVGLMIVILIATPLYLGFGSLISRFSNLKYVDLSTAGRVGMWLAAWEHRFDNILIGVGTGNFASILPAWAVGAGLRFPHNLFIEFYIEWGLFGLVAFVMLFLSPVIIWLRIRRKKEYPPETVRFANLLITFVAFMFVNSLADVTASDPFLYLPLGALCAIYSQKDKKCI